MLSLGFSVVTHKCSIYVQYLCFLSPLDRSLSNNNLSGSIPSTIGNHTHFSQLWDSLPFLFRISILFMNKSGNYLYHAWFSYLFLTWTAECKNAREIMHIFYDNHHVDTLCYPCAVESNFNVLIFVCSDVSSNFLSGQFTPFFGAG